MAREEIAGPDSGPSDPFPIQLSGRIVRGFGRGSKELGIPTANLPISGLEVGGYTNVESGVYYGWAGISLEGAIQDASRAAEPTKPGGASAATDSTTDTPESHDAPKVYKVVLSIGYNPYYKNEVRSVEVHVIHEFENDFYNATMNLSIEGFIRPERDYDSMQALIDDIKTDIEVTKKSLARPAYTDRAKDPFLLNFTSGN